MTLRQTCASAPGKVLITGGYLVLDYAYEGCVLSLSSRFYVTVKDVACSSSDKGLNDTERKISVVSPQFNSSKRVYTVLFGDKNEVLVKLCAEESEDKGGNGFIDKALYAMLLYLSRKSKLKFDLHITILADNDYYSQTESLKAKNLPATYDNLRNLPQFNNLGCLIKDVKKTGLGSSAALTSSLIGALYAHFEDIYEFNENDLNIIHNVAQYVHCAAQGKIGSGFDISSAVYGSQLYKRFDSAKLTGLIEKENVSLDNLLGLCNDRLNEGVQKIKLPPGIGLILIDVQAGSSTPSMVSSLMKWKHENREKAKAIWDKLSRNNNIVTSAIKSLTNLSETNLSKFNCDLLACLPYEHKTSALTSNNKVLNELTKMYNSFQEIRNQFRILTDLVGIPIEPLPQTKLIDSCLAVPGVIISGVPGAGGFDAVLCLYVKESEARKSILNLCETLSELNLCALLSEESNEGLFVEELNS